MNLYSDIVENFLNNFQKLTPNFKKIFRYLQGIAFKYRNVYPSVPTIAKNCGCSVNTVKRATALFRVLGFLRSQKVAYQSNYYYIIPGLIRLNTRDHNTFKNPPQSAAGTCVGTCVGTSVGPVFTTTKEIKDINTSTPVPVPTNKNKHQNFPIRACVVMDSLTQQQQQDLSDRYNDYALIHAIKDSVWYVKQGKVIKSMVKYLWNRAEAHS